VSNDQAETARILVELLRAGGLPVVLVWIGAAMSDCDPVLRLEVTTPEPVIVMAPEPIPVRIATPE
jgi:hypothetical protein